MNLKSLQDIIMYSTQNQSNLKPNQSRRGYTPLLKICLNYVTNAGCKTKIIFRISTIALSKKQLR